MAKIVFLCKGMRGDVQPLLAVAVHYKELHPFDEVLFACSPSVAAGFSFLLHTGISFFNLPDLATLILQDFNAACSLASSDAERTELLKTEAQMCLEAANGANLIVFNLFTLEGYYIAQHLNVPCIAASPFVLTRTTPSGFEEKFAEAQSDLYKRLKNAKDGEVSFAEVDHWMWRLFLNDFTSVCTALCISSLPFSRSSDGFLPLPVPLLYGVSPIIIDPQPYWPSSVKLTGYWAFPECLQEPPSSELVALVTGIDKAQLLYIGFGSMEAYMTDVDWMTAFELFDSALEKFNLIGLFQCVVDGRVAKAYNELQRKPSRVLLWSGSLPHPWLFRRCRAILHHGGSGTVATALLAGKPQVICPVMFDQQHWAEQLSWKGLALQCSSLTRLTESELSSAFNVLFKSKMAENVKSVAAQLADGTDIVVAKMEKLLGVGS